MHNFITTLLICGTVCLLSSTYFKAKFSEQLDVQRKRSMELYLDRQFIARMIERLDNTHAMELIEADIEKYFFLDAVLLFDLKQKKSFSDTVLYHITDYLTINFEEIVRNLEQKDFLNMIVDKKQLYIQFANKEKRHLAVYVISSENELCKEDIYILTSIATKLLNAAFIMGQNRT